MDAQHIQTELMGIHDAVALAQGAIANDPDIEGHETLMQASSVLNDQAHRIIRLIKLIEQTHQ